jgi:undecaprenyl-diphosphatase
MLWPHRSRQFIGVAVGYIVLMAWSRTYLRAHWLTDVVAGALFGAAVVLVIAGWLGERVREDSVGRSAEI